MPLISIDVIANGKISFYLWLYNIPLCVYIYHIFIHLCVYTYKYLISHSKNTLTLYICGLPRWYGLPRWLSGKESTC